MAVDVFVPGRPAGRAALVHIRGGGTRPGPGQRDTWARFVPRSHARAREARRAVASRGREWGSSVNKVYFTFNFDI